MQDNRVHALEEFLKVVPESIKIRGRKHHKGFHIIDSGQRIEGRLRAEGGEDLELRFDFHPEAFSIVDAHCNCSDVRKGALCEHITAFANELVEGRITTNKPNNDLEFLDKHFNSPAFQNAQFRLSVEILDSGSSLEPEIKFHKYIREGTFGVGRKFSANDSYKFTQGDPTDQNLLDYIRNFRQIFFYSNYTAEQRYNWGFWLTLVGHPRVIYKDRPVLVEAVPVRLELKGSAKSYQISAYYGEAAGEGLRYYEVDGGLLAFDPDAGKLLVCQMDVFRRAMLMEIQQYQPTMTKKQLVDNLARIEKLQKYFQLELPEELAGIIRREKPELVLMLDLQLGKGFSISPRIRYADAKARVVPGSHGQYLSTEGDAVVERDYDEELKLLDHFVETFPHEEKPDRNGDIQVPDLERALELIEWFRHQDTWALEWIKREPKVTRLSQVRGLRVQVDSKAWLKIHLMADDKVITIDRFDEDDSFLAGTGYVAVDDGEWLQIDQSLRRRLNRLKMAITQEKKAMKLKKAALAMLAEMDEITWEGDSEWLDKIDEWRGAGKDDHKPSKKLNADLRKYQLEGYRWLRRMSDLGVGACLADDMGLGKTVQALAVVHDRLKTGPILVVAPASVGYNWKEEVQRFAPTLKPILYADGRRSKSFKKLKGGDVVIVSYALVLKDIQKLMTIRWGTLILDEAQFIKNALSQTAIAVSQLHRDWTLALTGTPLENHLGELWSIFRMLNPELLGSWDNFRKSYVVPIEKGRDPQKLDNLRRLIRPFILRRTKQNVLEDLPERSDIVLKVELGDAQRARYEAERSRILAQLDEADEGIRFKLLAAITRLRQLACHPALCEDKYKGESAKLKLFSELVEELVSEDHRVLVFSQFTSFLSLIARELNRVHVPHVMMTGETPVKHRHAIIKRFQEGDVPVFLVSLRAGGTGLNLTHANYVIHMDPWWNPAVEEQATDRAHRIGQTQAVTVYRLVAGNTIEEAILNIHSRKKDLVESLLEGQESVGKLSISDLISLIKDQTQGN